MAHAPDCWTCWPFCEKQREGRCVELLSSFPHKKPRAQGIGKSKPAVVTELRCNWDLF